MRVNEGKKRERGRNKQEDETELFLFIYYSLHAYNFTVLNKKREKQAKSECM